MNTSGDDQALQTLGGPVGEPALDREPLASPRAPRVGIAMGLGLLLALGGWTATRIGQATRAQQAVAAKRAEDTQRRAALAAAPTVVHVIQPRAETWQPVVHFEGSLAAAQSAELSFKVPGRVTRLQVRLGDSVRAGALLASLDSSEAGAQLQAAQARLRAAQAELALTEDNEHRTSALVASGALPEANGVELTQQLTLARARLDSARADLSLSQVQLSSQNLLAPFAGTVTRVPDGVGHVVSPGSVQFELQDLDTLKLRGTVGESDANLVHLGSDVEIASEPAAVHGKVSALLGAVDRATRRVPIEVTIDNRGKSALRSGSFVRAQVLGGEPVPVLRVPHTALRPGSQDELLIAQEGTLVARHVTFAIAEDGALLVRRGLEPQARVVVAPTPEAQAGDRVSVAD